MFLFLFWFMFGISHNPTFHYLPHSLVNWKPTGVSTKLSDQRFGIDSVLYYVSIYSCITLLLNCQKHVNKKKRIKT
ncbi:hypothetical protein Hanom_Chr03g00179921 [Helianthus anomalus]